ncbi:uncharacterized protein LOC125224667 [Leguminivora glycinivorella]|uniref:uncharacterized protein LOC125224667 n=1 Tax=Leguminivora glycinivorella TaxID=1035111 RepID=UPI00200C23F9|nr:uncharacterized protein LOC125224667 [Leguminivora glycinivorella]
MECSANVFSECTSRDQTSPRANTLSDDQDDIQKQLDNEARDRLQFATPKTIWVLHFPTHIMQMPHSNKRMHWNSIKTLVHPQPKEPQKHHRHYQQHLVDLLFVCHCLSTDIKPIENIQGVR